MEISQLNANHKATLKKFREAVKDCQLPDSDDTFFLRWLIARDYDIPRAEKMLRNSLEWRRQYRIDSVREEFKSPEVFKKYFPAGFVGRDKYCNPLWVVRYGMADMKGILHSAKKKDYFMHVIGLVETSIWLAVDNPKRYRRTPDTLVQSTIIFDLDQFSMRHITYKPAMDAALQLIQLYEANYPELLRRVFVINAPKVFSIAFTMIKPFLHERTKSKISIFGHDSKQWKLAILEDVDPEELPASYGGTLTDPDGNENCITMVNMGGEVPKSYYFTGRTETINKTFLSISSGCKERLEYHVQEAGSVLKWNFHSQDSDIAFAIYRKQGNELISIVPHDRVDCHVSAEEGEIECDEPGVYIVEFDNGFSYLRSKKIWYTISVHPTSLNNGHNGNGLDNV